MDYTEGEKLIRSCRTSSHRRTRTIRSTFLGLQFPDLAAIDYQASTPIIAPKFSVIAAKSEQQMEVFMPIKAAAPALIVAALALVGDYTTLSLQSRAVEVREASATPSSLTCAA